MRFRVRGDPDREVAVLSDEPNQVDRVRQLAWRQVEILRWITAEGEDVLDAGVAIAGDDLDQLVATVRGTCEVRHGRHRRVAVDVDNEFVRAFTRRASGTVGDRHIRRMQRFESTERACEHRFHLVVARWRELERVRRAAAKALVNLHGRVPDH